MFVELKVLEPLGEPTPILLNTERIIEVLDHEDGLVKVVMSSGSEYICQIRGGYKQMKRFLKAQEQE